ncbi:MAG: hypothetical protein CM15mP75_1710 [Flammeovirgaceae bacterium]|nr:MAG: hypothetical protein CM15mP75_1710 [Flammeovirgaceae bacterium]
MVKMFEKALTFSGFNKFPNVSESIFENASLFGAKTVKGPSPLKAPTSHPAFKAPVLKVFIRNCYINKFELMGLL